MNVIAVVKKGNIIPIRIFTDWYKCGKWCDKVVNKRNGFDPTQYKIVRLL